MNGRILKLTVKRKWFDLIASGKKKIEYREFKPYWESRLVKSKAFGMMFYSFSEIHFRNGYSKNASLIRAKCLGIETDKLAPYPDPIDGFPEGVYFLIHIGEIIEIKDSANFNINQQTHGGQSVSQPAPNCLTATSPC